MTTGAPGDPTDRDRIIEGAVQLGMEEAIRLAHEAIERFPEMKKRHMFIAGGAALSSAILIGAAVAIIKRMRAGQTAQEAADDVTSEELDGVHLLERRRRPRAVEPEANAATEPAAEMPPPEAPPRAEGRG